MPLRLAISAKLRPHVKQRERLERELLRPRKLPRLSSTPHHKAL